MIDEMLMMLKLLKGKKLLGSGETPDGYIELNFDDFVILVKKEHFHVTPYIAKMSMYEVNNCKNKEELKKLLDKKLKEKNGL